MSVGLLPLQHLFQLTDDPLFQPGNVALADAKGIGGFLLGVLHAVHKAEAQLHDLPLPGGQLLHGAPEGGTLGGLLQLQATRFSSLPSTSESSSSLPSPSVFRGSSMLASCRRLELLRRYIRISLPMHRLA